jgi:hypothetical protein
VPTKARDVTEQMRRMKSYAVQLSAAASGYEPENVAAL